MDGETTPQDRRYIGAVEASKRLGIGRRTLYNWTLRGLVNPAKRLPSGVYRYDTHEIQRVADEMAKPPQR